MGIGARRSVCRRVEVHELHHGIGEAIAVHGFVLTMEALGQHLDQVSAGVERHDDLLLEVLPEIPCARRDQKSRVGSAATLDAQLVQRLACDPGDGFAKLGVRGGVRAQHPREATIHAKVGSLAPNADATPGWVARGRARVPRGRASAPA